MTDFLPSPPGSPGDLLPGEPLLEPTMKWITVVLLLLMCCSCVSNKPQGEDIMTSRVNDQRIEFITTQPVEVTSKGIESAIEAIVEVTTELKAQVEATAAVQMGLISQMKETNYFGGDVWPQRIMAGGGVAVAIVFTIALVLWLSDQMRRRKRWKRE